MKKSSYYYKALTKAEVGNTGTHEIYVRMPNDFDYEGFFNQKAVANGTVLEVKFTAIDITNTEAIEEPIRFVYFANSNKEKRMPGLGSLFAKHNVQEGDIFFMESVLENATTTIYIKFFKYGSMDLQPGQIYFTKIHSDEHITSFNKDNSLPLQKIFYGAPGTGKSCGIKKIIKEHNIDEKTQVIRTTFHPDSDYSTFVGAYKPTMEKQISKIYSYDQLIAILEEIKSQGITYPCHKFGAKYWESLRNLSEKSIKDLAIAIYGADTTMDQEIRKGMNVGEELLRNQKESKIVYTFVPQAFLKAYVAAWKNNEKEQKVFLVIEEINRGNCAQIFGDIFQLLDRNDNGESEYPIKADQDIQNYLAEVFADCNNLPKNIKSGEELVLPNNLYIWATMNTSDQSLFPIDSAFKRRWDWKYVPITKADDVDVKIQVGNNQYDWWDFIVTINDQISDVTSSEDKKLGYFFCKASEDEKISAKIFVNKVIFYLWNDVFKDYDVSHIAFKDGEDGKQRLAFGKFFKDDGLVNEATVDKFLQDLGLEPIGDALEDSGTDENTTQEQTDETIKKRLDFWQNFFEYSKSNPDFRAKFKRTKPSIDHWYTYGVFKSSKCCMCIEQVRKDGKFVISFNAKKELFSQLYEYKDEIDARFGDIKLEWRKDLPRSKKNSKVSEVFSVTNFEDPAERVEIYKHTMDSLLKMQNVFMEYLQKLSK